MVLCDDDNNRVMFPVMMMKTMMVVVVITVVLAVAVMEIQISIKIPIPLVKICFQHRLKSTSVVGAIQNDS